MVTFLITRLLKKINGFNDVGMLTSIMILSIVDVLVIAFIASCIF